jgi:hypothetical protein
MMVVTMMDMRQHTFNSVRERSGAVNEEKQPSRPIFSMRRIRILHICLERRTRLCQKSDFPGFEGRGFFSRAAGRTAGMAALSR